MQSALLTPSAPTHLGLARRKAGGCRTIGPSLGDGGKIGDGGAEIADSSSDSLEEVQKDEVDPLLLDMSSSSTSVMAPNEVISPGLPGPPRALALVSSMALPRWPEPTIVQKVRIIVHGSG